MRDMGKINLQILAPDNDLELILKDTKMYDDFQIMNLSYGDFIFVRRVE